MRKFINWGRWSNTTRFHFVRFAFYCAFAVPDMIWLRDLVAMVSLMSIVALIEGAASVFMASRAKDEAES